MVALLLHQRLGTDGFNGVKSLRHQQLRQTKLLAPPTALIAQTGPHRCPVTRLVPAVR